MSNLKSLNSRGKAGADLRNIRDIIGGTAVTASGAAAGIKCE